MGKRFFISAFLIIVIIALIAVGAAFFFDGRYSTLAASQAEQSAEATQDIDQMAAEAGAVLEGQAVPDTSPAVIASPTPYAPSDSTAPADTGSDAEEAAPVVSAEPDAPAEDPNTARAETILSGMSLEDKICQMLFVTPEALTGYTKVTQSGDVTREALSQWPVGGIIYFGSNLVTVDQTTSMISDIQSYAQELTGRRLFIGVDEEGGSVARAADALGTTQFDDMAVYGEAGDTEAAYNIGATQASDLTALGFNVNFSPVADVLTNEENTVVKSRSFGSDPDLVSSMVTQVVKGLTDGGMLCAPKHFPGHGSTGGDTHDGFAASDRTLEELEACDFKPFEAAIEAGAPMIMVGHMTMTAIDPDNPASLSKTIVTDLLRNQLGYNGIIITDALNMGAISQNYTGAECAVKAISAGCDMLLCVGNISSVVSAVSEAVADGTIPESQINDSVTRILTAKLQYGIISE
ncbi:MAG: glycoside hydrolase family 3 N-terminal domain-containing protein [Oscillospiraceae bacterium]|nr:glycoside hydrolase family 3 N-terminal domain-containing protein [Oscillospiraceae bacterium]